MEVDRETGEVTFLRYAAVHDCGRIINPKLVEGQMYGGMAQGLGQALMEGMVYTPEGQPLVREECLGGCCLQSEVTPSAQHFSDRHRREGNLCPWHTQEIQA